jgi:hypothetical protein
VRREGRKSWRTIVAPDESVAILSLADAADVFDRVLERDVHVAVEARERA